METAAAIQDELPLVAPEHGEASASGLFNVSVESLATWARRISERSFIDDGFSPAPRNASLALTAEAVRRSSDATKALQGRGSEVDQRERPSLHRAMLRAIIEAKKSGWKPGDLAARSQSRFRREVDAVYAESEHLLTEAGWCDVSDTLIRAAEQLRSNSDLHGVAGIALVGFVELNELEWDLVDALAAHALPLAAYIPHVAESPAFATTAALVRDLERRWGIAACAVEPRAAAPATRLAGDLLRPRSDHVDNTGVSLVSAPDPVREWQDLARRIWHEIENSPDLRFADIMVAVPDAGSVRGVIRDVFEQADIPLDWDAGIPLIETGAGRGLAQLVEVFGSGMSRSAVMDFLTCAALPAKWTGGTRDNAPPTEWDRISLQIGISGGKTGRSDIMREWIAPLRHHEMALAARAERAISSPDLDDDADVQRQLELDGDHTRTLLDVVKQLAHHAGAIAQADAGGSWRAWVDALRTCWEEFVEPGDNELSAHVRVAGILDELARLDGTVTLPSAATRREILLDALRTATVPTHSDTEGAVRITSIAAASFRRARMVFITGLVDGRYPSPERRDALAVTPPGTVPNIDAEDDQTSDGSLDIDAGLAIERLRFALALATASERTVLSHSRGTTGGEETLLPSSLYFDVASRVLDNASGSASNAIWDLASLRTALLPTGNWSLRRPVPIAGEGTSHLNENEFRFARAVGASDGAEAAGWLGAKGFALLTARGDSQPGVFDGVIIGTAAAEALHARIAEAPPMSPTRLETYATCPLRYLFQHVLQLQPLPEPAWTMQIDPLTRGSLIHGLLAGFFQHLMGNGVDLNDLSTDETRARFDGFAANLRAEIADRGDIPSGPVWDADWRTIAERAWRGVALARAESGEWRARYLEFGLGVTPGERNVDAASSPEPITLSDGSTLVRLRGIIDRVDISRDGGAARIFDYKSGRRQREEFGMLNGGRSIQLAAYSAGLRNWLDEHMPGVTVVEACYHYLRDDAGDLAAARSASGPVDSRDADTIRQEIVDLGSIVRTAMGGINAGNFPPCPAESPATQFSTCAQCDVGSACGSHLDLARRVARYEVSERTAKVRSMRVDRESARA